MDKRRSSDGAVLVDSVCMTFSCAPWSAPYVASFRDEAPQAFGVPRHGSSPAQRFVGELSDLLEATLQAMGLRAQIIRLRRLFVIIF
jgi:hypothetical protein